MLLITLESRAKTIFILVVVMKVLRLLYVFILYVNLLGLGILLFLG